MTRLVFRTSTHAFVQPPEDGTRGRRSKTIHRTGWDSGK